MGIQLLLQVFEPTLNLRVTLTDLKSYTRWTLNLENVVDFLLFRLVTDIVEVEKTWVAQKTLVFVWKYGFNHFGFLFLIIQMNW